MRVVLATPASERGGVWKHVLDLAQGLLERGHEVQLAVPADATDLQVDAAEHGLSWVPGLRGVLASTADLVHIHLPKTFETSILRWLPVLRVDPSRTTVLTEHLPRVPASDSSLPWGPAAPPGLRKPGARHAKTLIKKVEVALSDAVITVSAHSREFMVQRYGVSPGRLHSVPNGVSPAAAPPAWLRQDDDDRALEVICVGTLAWRKGYDVLIEAARLATRPWQVTVVGAGDAGGQLQRASRGLPLVSFDWVGWRADASVASAAGDVLCLPSRSEAMPYAVLEAMACGRPVVATAVDGVPELVEHGVSGLLVPAEDPAALAAALDGLAADAPLRAAMGSAARARVLRSFTLDTMVDRTIEVYVAARRRRSA